MYLEFPEYSFYPFKKPVVSVKSCLEAVLIFLQVIGICSVSLQSK